MATKKQLAERAEAIATLSTMVQAGTVVYTILRHVSSSGMSRDISLLIKDGDGLANITYLAAKAMGDTLKEKNGHHVIRATGCGMDMGFALVYNLGRTLFPDGFYPVQAGRSYGRNGTSNEALDTDGGYALKHEWL